MQVHDPYDSEVAARHRSHWTGCSLAITLLLPRFYTLSYVPVIIATSTSRSIQGVRDMDPNIDENW
jgi:hypothetical protein